MYNNVDEQVHSRDQILRDDQLSWEYYEYPGDIYLSDSPSSCVEQSQNSHAYPFYSVPSSTTAERFAVFTEHLPYGSLHTPNATGTVEFDTSSNPGLWQSQSPDFLQWSGMSSNWTHVPVTHGSVPQMLDGPDGPLCDWSRDFEPPPPPTGIPGIPQSLPSMLPNSYATPEEYDPWLRHAWDRTVNTCTASPDMDTSLSTLDFLSAFAEYDSLPDARADPQPSTALTHNATSESSTQPAAFPYSEFPTCEPPRQDRFIPCQWLTNGVLCGESVMPNRCSVVEHLQLFHRIKPGEEKARERCFWAHCGTELNKESLARHILTVHLKEKVYCAECRMLFAREDSLKRHRKGGHHKVPLDKSAARQPSRNNPGFR
ncbi:hypothetical protein J3R82DRAFT_11320 [Butyriboletus roseoflavus]|nr:hypothetical protein J3R82DRAFT_11320 [Butyriboletus roseoflavus]